MNSFNKTVLEVIVKNLVDCGFDFYLWMVDATVTSGLERLPSGICVIDYGKTPLSLPDEGSCGASVVGGMGWAAGA